MRTQLTLIAGAAAAAALALPAAAQVYTVADGPYVDEVVVTPLYTRHGPDRLSKVVSLRDLDLTTLSGREVMRIRIRDAARDVCRTLGEESRAGGPLLRSCEQQAMRDVRPQMRVAVNTAYRNHAYAYNEYYPFTTY